MRFYSTSIALTGQGSVGTRACSPQYLPFLPCLSQMCIIWPGESLFFLSDNIAQAEGLPYESFHVWTRPCRKLFSARYYLFLKLASYLKPGCFCKSCPFWWKDTRHDVERGPVTVMGLSKSDMSTGATCCGLAVVSFCLPCMVLCPLIRNTLFCKLTNKGRIPAASSYPQMKCLV